MAIQRPNPLVLLLSIAGLFILSCSLTGKILESLTPASTQTTPKEIAPNITFTRFPPTIPIPSASPTTHLIEQPAHTLQSPTETLLPGFIESQPTTTPLLGDASLTGLVFFDYDGDGLRGEQEPGLADVHVCVTLPPVELCAQSDANGQYTLVGVPPGAHKIFILSPSDEPSQAFRFINIFKGWIEIADYQVEDIWVPWQDLPNTELQHIEDPLMVDIQPETELDIAITQGYLTDIFACGDRDRVQTYQLYDLDPREGYVRNFMEAESHTISTSSTLLTGDNHFAIDWGDSNQHIIGTPLYAPANGIVVFAGIVKTPNGECKLVKLAHPETGDTTGILHLEKVLVRDLQKVMRGQLLGTLGQSCATWPHVHFFLRTGSSLIGGQWEGVDPYRDTADPNSFSYWTKDNDPQCPTFIIKH